MRRSAQWLKPATKSAAPRGNSASASPTGIPMRRAAARNAGASPAVERHVGQHRRDQPLGFALGERAPHPAPCSAGEKRRQVDRVALQFFEEDEEAVVGHPLRIEDAVEVVAFVLDDPGVEALRLALDRLRRRGSCPR